MKKHPETIGLLAEMYPGRAYASLSEDEARAYRREWLRRRRAAMKANSELSYSDKWYRANREGILAHRRAKHAADPPARNAHTKKWRKNNPDKVREMRRKWRQKNPDKVREQHRAWAKRYPERAYTSQKRRALMKAYGITLEQFEAMFAAQDGRCAICGTTEANSRGHKLHVDHDHRTGYVRGLLCGRCNSAIGYFDEEPERLRCAAQYVEERRGKTVSSDAGGVRQVLERVPEEGSQAGRDEGLQKSA